MLAPPALSRTSVQSGREHASDGTTAPFPAFRGHPEPRKAQSLSDDRNRGTRRVASSRAVRCIEDEAGWNRWKVTVGWRSCARAALTLTCFLERCSRTSLKNRDMRAKVFWVAGFWRGRLGILPRPRGGDWLGDETRGWREAGVDMVVSLLEPEEQTDLVLEGEAAAAAASGVEFRSFPIPDRGVPTSRELTAEVAGVIAAALETGRNVAVHCRQGIGRSALMVGGVLVASGTDPNTAFRTIEESRGIGVPETEEQRQWLRDFASWLVSRPAAQQAAGADEPRSHDRSGSQRS